MNLQIIEKNGLPEWAVIPYRDYLRYQEALEDAEDIKDIETNLKALHDGTENTIPGEVTFAILDGVSPIRAWRKYQNLTMKDLAQKVGLSPAYLSQIETGKRNPTIDTLKSIAKELNIEPEILI